jgi:hypothetical protein
VQRLAAASPHLDSLCSLALKLLTFIEYRAKSAEGQLRHPLFKGIREDL